MIAFTRGGKVLVAVPRFAWTLAEGKRRLPLGGIWGQDELIVPEMAAMRLVNVFTGEALGVGPEGRLPLREVFAEFPVAMLAVE